MPARMSWIAVKCRRLWRRTSGAPTASRTRKKNDVTLSGRKGGVGGIFERLFAPRVMKRIYEDELGRLDEHGRSLPD
nr:hypothetical protein [Actinomycetota bacterium]